MKYFLLPFVFLLSVSVASACSFGPDADRMQPAESNVGKYEHVFVATIVQKEEKAEFAENNYTFDIHKVYKGDLFRDTVDSKIEINSPGHSCGSFFSEGQIGLFFLNDSTTIDESNPQYFYDSKEQALQVGELLFADGPVLIDPEIETPVINTPKPCTREYRPVCGELPVQCVQAPCPPVQQTFGNACTLESQGATFLYEGECKVGAVQEKPSIQEEIDKVQEATNSFEGPTVGPLVDFVAPTSPPPSKDVPQEVEKRSKMKIITDWYKDLISGFIAWIF